MCSYSEVTCWAAFGAVAQAVGALATFFAVAVSIWVVQSERALKAKASAGIRIIVAGDGTPGIYMAGVDILNSGYRQIAVTGFGWRIGWSRRGPKVLRFQYAMQNATVSLSGRKGVLLIDPGQNDGLYSLLEDMKSAVNDKLRNALFGRVSPMLGAAPIKALIHITGRKPLVVKIPNDLAEFLRTGHHHATKVIK